MCGIMGYIGRRSVSDVLVDGLRQLEYRGYDSAGVALMVDGQIEVHKSQGRIDQVELLLAERGHVQATAGIGHTRWATHGKPTTVNAHPHRVGHVVLVHNGIIENYRQLRRELELRGLRPVSETDSELFGWLVYEEMEAGSDFKHAVCRALSIVRGQCSIVIVSEREPDCVIGARFGSPLVIANDPEGGVFFSSDPQPLTAYTKSMTFLEHGDIGIGYDSHFEIIDSVDGHVLERAPVLLQWTAAQMDRGGYAHFMLKEIYDQPQAMLDTLDALLDPSHTDPVTPFALADQVALRLLVAAKSVTFVACGTSFHAAMLGKYWIEALSGVKTSVEVSSEFRYRSVALAADSLIIGISQSGETADTLAVLRDMKRQGVPTLTITNVRGSTMAREADGVLYTSAGPEIGVAATKTFMVQMLVVFLLAGFLARNRKSDGGVLQHLTEDLVRMIESVRALLQPESALRVRDVAYGIGLEGVTGFFFMGRGYCYPLALEGALKLKEIAYEFAEGYAAGELKHGPIAMIDRGMVVVVLAPFDGWRDKTVSNLEEVRARGARIVGVGAPNDHDLQELCDYFIPLPAQSLDARLAPFLLAPIVQLFSYYRALMRGTDVDRPRNLAKSVTVE